MQNYPNAETFGTGVSVASQYMRKVYMWMGAGLLATALVAAGVASSQQAMNAIYSNPLVLILLIVAQFGLVIALSAAVHKMSAETATFCFLLYAVLTGATLSSIFVAYPMGSIANAFLTTAGMFTAMAIYGTVTRRDLTGMGSFLFMGLVGLLIAMIVNFFLGSALMDFVISCVGVVIFTGLTAYDTQQLRVFGGNAPMGDQVAVRRGAILGALTLYLDFINLFLMLLRLFGNSRD